MPQMNRIFTGKLNYDTHPFRVPANDFIEAMNMTRDSEGFYSDSPINGIKGNQLVPYTLHSGTNKCIGNFPDKVKNRIYYFVWNSEDYHSILYYDKSNNTVLKIVENLTDTNSIDILKFDPSYRINHIDIIYRDEGDLLFWTDGLNPPRKLNVLTATTGGYGVWQESYINVIKSPAQVPPEVVYEDDSTVSVNNLRKKLFKIKYEFEYDDFEKSVTSSQSELPLPVNYTDVAVDKDPTKNARIAIVVQTGTSRVKKIRILAAQSLGNTFSDFFLIKVIDKSADGVSDNDITTYRFYNDQAYNYIPVQQSLLAFDWIPQKAYTQCLPNGNVLTYGAITEGYDYEAIDGTSLVSDITARTTQLPFIFTASQSGNSGFGSGNIHAIVIGSVVVGDTFNIYTTNQTITFASAGTTTAAVITGLAAAATVAGFTVVSSDTENLVITKTGESLQRIYAAPTTRAVTDSFAFDYNSRYAPSLVYFDKEGRTDGAITKSGLVVQTNGYGKSGGVQTIPKLSLSISSRPPIWADYYHVLFSKNTTESNLLDWVSDRTYKDTDYAYIGIENLNTFIKNNPTTPLGYSFVQNDRIRFMQVLSGSVNTIYGNTVDFEIIGQVVNPEINGDTKTGLFVKIALPTTTGTFDFGTSDFYNYYIKLYTPAQSVANGLDVYYEVSERYAIGNAGTTTAFHQGMLQNQTANLVTPATFEFTKGDFYYRNRTINTGAEYLYDFTTGEKGEAAITLGCSYTSSTYTDANITTGSSPLENLAGFDISTNNDRYLLKIGTGTFTFRLKGTIKVTFNASAQIYSFYFANNLDERTYIANSVAYSQGDLHVIDFDVTVTLTTGQKLFIFGNGDFTNSKQFSATEMTVTRQLPFTVGVIDPNFSDYFPSAVNSYGRAWVEDTNAKQTYYPTLRRNGGEYQQDTTTNNINRFYFDAQDTYNRSFGDIRKLFVNGSKMYVFQKFDIGVVPILTQVVRDVTGNPLQANSDILLNKIYYPYAGKIGIGDVPESFAHGKFAMYGVDNNKAIVWRLSNDGLTPLSVAFKANSFFVTNLSAYRSDLNNGITPSGGVYTGNPTVYGVYDGYTNKYIVALEEINRYSNPSTLSFHQDPYTISYLETRDSMEGFESKYSYYPENLGCLDNLMVAWKNGGIWTHDSETYANFFGQQGDVEVTLCFNDIMTAKKTLESLFMTSNVVWTCPEITTSLVSHGTTLQQSYLIESDFTELEGEFTTAFKRDTNSNGGRLNGDVLKGQYIIIKFRAKTPENFVFLNSVSVDYIESPLNKR